MTHVCFALQRPRRPSARQLSLRRRSRRLSLRRAVRVAADGFFRFRYRATKAVALWSAAEQVWLGRETFLHWALWDTGIDIPWLVARAADAPDDAEQLLAAVREELAAYWDLQFKSLPRSGTPYWLPLP